MKGKESKNAIRSQHHCLSLSKAPTGAELVDVLVRDAVRIAVLTCRVFESNSAQCGVLACHVMRFPYTAVLRAVQPFQANAMNKGGAA